MPKQIEDLVNEQVARSEVARRRAAARGEAGAHPVITISRRLGTGARIIAEKLAHDLGYSLWDRDLVDAIATDAHVSRRIAEAFDEKTISEIEVLLRTVFGDQQMGAFIYAIHLARALASIAKLGNAIILGRGAGILLPDALNVRIDASDEHRVRNMVTYEGLTEEAAAEQLRESDRAREHFLASTFGKERLAHARFDLTLCMDEFTPDDAAEIIKTAIRVRCKLPAG